MTVSLPISVARERAPRAVFGDLPSPNSQLAARDIAQNGLPDFAMKPAHSSRRVIQDSL